MWRRAEIPLVSAVNFQVVIEGISGPGYQGDIALDDVSFTPSCRPDTTATISPTLPTGIPPPGCNVGQFRYVILYNIPTLTRTIITGMGNMSEETVKLVLVLEMFVTLAKQIVLAKFKSETKNYSFNCGSLQK